ncbi:hypothetical protein [Pontiella sulfatireligans]|uniref:Beta-barrel assembly-enhancing protease n=1 Tax=Pontiella sulfatireligans TaxID=2750658 RepID=A0A6C2UKH1_9BACT|nr:hypothetical protein [Pontiella sulfatireligans]VGO19901.1 hypothetical protein SCARR_01961 [Pontiella sulfatireligans]
MKTTRAISMLASGLLIAVALSACKTNQSPVTTAQLDAFMKRWETYEAFKTPVDPKDEPLLLAALEKDPKGPWATYVIMKFSQTRFEARQLDNAGRTARYRASLNYLKPARDTLARAVEANPEDKELQHFPNEIKTYISLATLEAGLDLADIKSDAEAALANNTDTQSWNYGNIIYDQHSLLGRVALREGKLDEAKRHLLEAGRTPGSPQLNSYGPNFILARELAEKGEFDTVIEFLDLVARFWANPDERTEANSKCVANDHLKLLNAWKQELRAGKVPDHGTWK